MRIACLSLVALLAAPAVGQTVEYESLTTTPWTHTSTVGTWNNAINDTRSTFGKLDHLVSAPTFSYSRAPLTLQPGTYVADVRFAKITNATGAADITFRAISTSPAQIVSLATDHTVDQFLNTKALLIQVSVVTPVIFFLENTSTTGTKSDYMFDSFHIGKVERGQAVLVESMGRRWGHSWGAPHYCKEHADPTSQFGFVERLNEPGATNCGTGGANLWWFAWNSGTYQFLPGEHTFNCRIKKVTSTVGAHDFDLWVRESIDNGQNWTNYPKVVWKASTHEVDKWVYSPNISFTVRDPNHLYQFRLSRTSGSIKGGYHFDSFEVRRGRFTPLGTSCMNGGQAELHGWVPQLNQQFDVEIGPLGANANPVTLILGVGNPDLDLSPVGWAGCSQYASLDILLRTTVTGGVASFSRTLPNSTVLIGFPFFMQGFQTTATGVETTNGAAGLIAN